MPADELVPPEAYSWWVPTVGALLLLAVAVWYAWVLWRTRPDGRGRREQAQLPGTVRQHYEQQVEVSYRRYRGGELDLRALHLELAQTMREFAGHRLGSDVRSWTRADAAGHGAAQRVAELLARWEEPAFAARSDAEAAASAHAAREVIRSW